jgi:hypothetical protein
MITKVRLICRNPNNLVTLAKRPKTRYSTGGGSKIILFLRKILSDKMFDRLMLDRMNQATV